MAGLSPQTLCNLYTLAEIETKITYFMEAMEGATVRLYDKDTTQGRQKVESEEIQRIESILQSWLKAKECKLGMGKPNIVSATFGGRGF